MNLQRRAQPRKATALARTAGAPGRVEGLPPATPTMPTRGPPAGGPCPECSEPNRERARFCATCGSGRAVAIPWPLQVRKTVTVLFCDVTGSTTLGESQDPERVRRVMTRYFDETRSAVERHGGRVEKYIGDAVMAVFGVPPSTRTTPCALCGQRRSYARCSGR